ncbi:MAG: hypothetical protein K2H14_04155 [Muribaculaceae bacterium]|nr:hypothetical protein [Muribaculaceae bacterium]
MNIPLITWCCIAAVSVLIICVRLYHGFTAHHHRHESRSRLHRNRIIEVGSESEELFIPGDPQIKEGYAEGDE